jgi:nickel-dependent lactate racemase
MEIPCKPADIVITSNSGYPLDINLYQSMKGMDTAAAAAIDGVVIIISTECAEGIGHGGFSEVYKMGDNPQSILDGMRTGRIKVFDQWGAQVMLRLSQKYTIIVVTRNIDKVTLNRMFVEHAESLQEALEMAFELKGRNASINIIPEGPVIIPKVK